MNTDTKPREPAHPAAGRAPAPRQSLVPVPSERAEIDDFLTRYAHVLDDGLFDAWADFFTADGVYEITTRENVAAGYPLGVMSCVGQGMMRDRIAALQSANVFEEHVYTHILGRAEVLAEGTRRRVRSNFAVYRTVLGADATLFAAGKYLDELVRAADGGLRIAHRRVVLDSRRIDTLLVLPL